MSAIRGRRLAVVTPTSKNRPESAETDCQNSVAAGIGTATHCHATAMKNKPVNIGSAINCHAPATTAANCVALKSHSSGSAGWRQWSGERDDLPQEPTGLLADLPARSDTERTGERP
jgi:hypothetical protein